WAAEDHPVCLSKIIDCADRYIFLLISNYFCMLALLGLLLYALELLDTADDHIYPACSFCSLFYRASELECMAIHRIVDNQNFHPNPPLNSQPLSKSSKIKQQYLRCRLGF